MQVIRGGLAAFDGSAFGLPTPDAMAYFQSQITNIGNVVGEYADMFKQSVAATYERFTNADVLNKARLALQHTTANEARDVIRPFYTVEDFQTAQPMMQRWVMASPIVRESYHRQTCDGYSGTYVDNAPGMRGETHYDYRRVMDGVIQIDDEDDTDRVVFYAEDLNPGDTELTHHDKVVILNTWDIVGRMFRAGQEDPTNPFGGNL